MTALTPGTRLHDRFVLVEPIGAGGMAEVWRAQDEVLGRSVAVKVLDARAGGDATRRIATRREAQAAARLSHPNVTRVYDYGEADLPDGRSAPYLVMELLSGRGLGERLAEGPLPMREALAVAGQVAGALAAAHAIGVVHCDVKPGNVMLTETGAKVLDFGIAAITGDAAVGRPLYGTPGYLAPERRAGAEAAPPTDVYGLGVLLAEALTGRRPNGGFPAVPGLPPEVARLGAASLSADPAERPTADELARALATAAGPATGLSPAAAAAPTVVAHHPAGRNDGPQNAAAGPNIGSHNGAAGPNIGPHTATAGANNGPNNAGPDDGRPLRPATKVMPAGRAMVGRAPVAPPSVRPGGTEGPGRPLPPSNRRPLLIGTAIALALIVVAAVVLAIMNRPDGGDGTGTTPSAGANPGATTGGGDQPTTDPPPAATTEPAQPTPTSEQSADVDPNVAAVAAFEQEVAAAANRNEITPGALNKINDRIEKLRRAIAENKDVDEAVKDLRDEVNKEGVADSARPALLALLAPIGGSEDDDT